VTQSNQLVRKYCAILSLKTRSKILLKQQLVSLNLTYFVGRASVDLKMILFLLRSWVPTLLSLTYLKISEGFCGPLEDPKLWMLNIISQVRKHPYHTNLLVHNQRCCP